MEQSVKDTEDVVILFAGDSGDGIQLTGGQFTDTIALFGSDVSTFPNYPADIRAPVGTTSGVSGFQLKFGSAEVFTPGDQYDVLVVMNAAALRVNLPNLKKGGIIIANSDGFDSRNLRLAQYIGEENPLQDRSLDGYEVHAIEVTKLTREALKDSGLGMKAIDRCKNMFVLGFVYWMFSQDLANTIRFINHKFQYAPEVRDANLKALNKGHHYGDTMETFTSRFDVKSAQLPAGAYRNINGNQAMALGLVAAAKRNDLELFYASYPITPASDILHELSRHKRFGVKTFQAEDEIAAICAAIGSSFAGGLAVTGSSGPGIALKGEALGLAVMLELPVVIINVQRGGPSTGLPTKTEQADLLQAAYGRNGEAPLPILAASSPRDCFDTVYEAARIAVEYMTPVMVLSDGYIANGAEPWKFPTSAELHPFQSNAGSEITNVEGVFMPYARDDRQVRPWVKAGTPGKEHRIGGLEKELVTGNVSYDPENHERMVAIREGKVAGIAKDVPAQIIHRGEAEAKVCVLSWGSTFGAIETAIRDLLQQGVSVAHVHLRYLYPFPANLKQLLSGFETILIPEMNRGQLAMMIRHQFLIDARSISKVQGLPFTVEEIKKVIQNELSK
ncbi:MAG: 2-oxoacid:acceptor oxidoreductase subunit alpha [Bacteroidota bacterium]